MRLPYCPCYVHWIFKQRNKVELFFRFGFINYEIFNQTIFMINRMLILMLFELIRSMGIMRQ